MNRLSKNEKGFSAIEVVLVFVILALIGVVGWLVYKNHHQTTKASVVTTSKPSPSTPAKSTIPTKPVNPYAGWKTYTSGYQKVSFQYPTSWGFKVQSDTGAPSSSAQEVVLTSPSGITLTYYDYVGGVGGACGTSTQVVSLTAVQQITTANSPHPLYLVESGNQIGLDMETPAPTVGSTGNCLFYPLITSDVNTGQQLGFTTSNPFPAGTPAALPSNQTQDYATAKLILESFKYN